MSVLPIFISWRVTNRARRYRYKRDSLTGLHAKRKIERSIMSPLSSLRFIQSRTLSLLAVVIGIPLFGLSQGTHSAILLLLGLALGATMFYADFGFTGAYRRLMIHRDRRSVMPQLLFLALSCFLFSLVLSGDGYGQDVVGATAPVSLSVAIGALMFGIGMQLAGGCGSGTLYALGRGSIPMLVTLPAFCFGGFWASLHGWWQDLPSFGEIVLGEKIGWPLAVALQILFLTMLAWAIKRWTTHADKSIPSYVSHSTWAWWLGPLLLASLCVLTLLVAGHPWTITWAFTLWAAKVAMLLGWDANSSYFWQGDFQQHALHSSILSDTTSLMDIGLIAGTFVAALLSGGLVFRQVVQFRMFVAALAGGLLMGYGSRIAYGCNIGAFVSGVSSTSLHGWLWILLALPGNWLGIQLRRRLGLAV